MLLRASLVQFFLHICYMWFSFWGTKSPRLHTEPGLCPWTPMGDFRPQTPHILISQLAKLSYTHGRTLVEARTWRARERGAPSRVQGQSPWSGGQGAKPPEAEKLFAFRCPMCPYFPCIADSVNHLITAANWQFVVELFYVAFTLLPACAR